MTATGIIYQALRLLAQLGPGQGASPEQNADGLVALNDMIASWSTERLNIFTTGVAAYSLTTTVQNYLIGTGQTLNGARPIKIAEAGILSPGANNGVVIRTPLKILSDAGWDAIMVKSATSQVPEKLYYDYAFPFGNIKLWPVPVFSATLQLELTTWIALTLFPDLVTDETFPPGYEDAIRLNLALRISSQYPGAAVTQQLLQNAAEAKAGIRALNAAYADDANPEREPPTTTSLNAIGGQPPAGAQ